MVKDSRTYQFSWQSELKRAERKKVEHIKNMERIGKGTQVMEAKAALLELRQRIKDLYG